MTEPTNESDIQLPIKSIRLDNGDEFTLGGQDPNNKWRTVEVIRQTPQGYAIEVRSEVPVSMKQENAHLTHEALLYIIHPSKVTWVCAGEFYVSIDEEE